MTTAKLNNMRKGLTCVVSPDLFGDNLGIATYVNLFLYDKILVFRRC